MRQGKFLMYGIGLSEKLIESPGKTVYPMYERQSSQVQLTQIFTILEYPFINKPAFSLGLYIEPGLSISKERDRDSYSKWLTLGAGLTAEFKLNSIFSLVASTKYEYYRGMRNYTEENEMNYGVISFYTGARIRFSNSKIIRDRLAKIHDDSTKSVLFGLSFGISLRLLGTKHIGKYQYRNLGYPYVDLEAKNQYKNSFGFIYRALPSFELNITDSKLRSQAISVSYRKSVKSAYFYFSGSELLKLEQLNISYQYDIPLIPKSNRGKKRNPYVYAGGKAMINFKNLTYSSNNCAYSIECGSYTYVDKSNLLSFQQVIGFRTPRCKIYCDFGLALNVLSFSNGKYEKYSRSYSIPNNLIEETVEGSYSKTIFFDGELFFSDTYVKIGYRF